MAQCLKCGAQAAEHPFRVLEVQTLHVRDINGEKRVQALGLFQDWAVCGLCAAQRVEAAKNPCRLLVKRCWPFALVLAAGILLTALVRSDTPAINLLGPAAIFCGLGGGISSFRQEQARNRTLRELLPKEALARAAWECLVAAAPKKDGDNDLTYIPVNPQTRAMSGGELVAHYDLLPAIAVKAQSLLQEDEA